MLHGRASLANATLLLICLVVGCRVGEAPAPRPEPGPVADSVVAPVTERTAAELLEEGGRAYEIADAARALALAEQVLAEYPETDAATAALWLAARASYAVGDYDGAAGYAYRYGGRFTETSPEAREALRLAFDAEDAAAEALPPGPAPVVGAILPRSGSAVMRRYGDWVLEGVELAVEEYEARMGREVELVVLDDSAQPGRAAELARELERRGAVAILGPLLDYALAAAAHARFDRDLVVVSPTATTAPPGQPKAFALNAGDTRGAQALATLVWDLGFDRAAVVYPQRPTYRRKAGAFEVEFEALGGDILTTAPYDSGTTTFAGPLRTVLHTASPPVDTLRPFRVVVDSFPGQHDSLWAVLRARRLMGARPEPGLQADSPWLAPAIPDTIPADTLGLLDTVGFGLRLGDDFEPLEPWPPPDTTLPDSLVDDTVTYRMAPWALFVPAPTRDIRQIAPQMEFYGLDTAGVQVFGDMSWTSPEVLRLVDARALEGVLAASPLDPAEGRQGVAVDFVERYEAAYRRTLSNPLPALGYDAASLVLAALPRRDATVKDVALRFSFVAGLRGATGVFSVYGNDIVRSPYLVTIRGGRLVPAPAPFEYEMPVPVPPQPPEPDSTELTEEEEPPGRAP